MDSEKGIEEKGISQVISLMGLAARTAPKAKGMDNLVISAFSGADKDNLAQKMEEIASEGYQSRIFSRDAQNLRRAQAVLVIGTKLQTFDLDCNFCGFESCAQCEEAGARCAYNLVDLGIALQKQINNLDVTVFRCPAKRSDLLVLTTGIWVGSMLQQSAGYLKMSLLCCQH